MEVVLATPDLVQERQLTFNDVDESHPMLSPDKGALLLTEGTAESHRTRVVLMDLKSNERRVLTQGDTFGAIPAISRTGLNIVFAEWTFDRATATFSTPRIVLLDTVTGTRRHISPAERESWRPVFSPDGTTIYYISKVAGQFDLYAHELSSGREVRLTSTPFDEWDPQVSPEGRRLVYAAHLDDNWDLFLLDLSTGHSERLTATKGDEWDPSFTPDGHRILFGGRFGVLETVYDLSLN